MEALLQRGASVCVRDIRGRSPLHMASACGRVGALGALLQANATPSHTVTHLTDNQGYTPLHWACYNGMKTHLTNTWTQNRRVFESTSLLSLRVRCLRGGVVGPGSVQEDYGQLVQSAALCRVRQSACLCRWRCLCRRTLF